MPSVKSVSKNKNILVTGGAGYIGAHACKALSRAGYMPMTYDNLVYGHSEAVKWGPFVEGDIPETHLIPLVLDVAAGKRQLLTIFGDDYDTPDGTCIRDYIHVEDLAQAHVLGLKALEEGAKSNIYNLGNGKGFSVKEVVDAATRVTGRKIPVKLGARRAGDPPCLVGDSYRIRRELGWSPRLKTLEAIIQTAWDWRRHHPNGQDGRW